ncbi:putative integrase/recombinase [Chlamydia trachomatis]|nr:putative integrase/recombinase [Chlamydia trachomatis]
MRSTFNILFYINRSKLRTDGTTVILCRITIDGSKVVISTGESISPKDWSVKRQETNDKKQNQRLQSFREKIEQGYNALLLQFGAVSVELLKNHLQGVGANPNTLLALSREELSIVQSTRALNTYQSCRCYHRQLEFFVESKGEADIPLTTITMEFFDDYRIHLKRKGYALSTTKQTLFWLSRLMYRAVSQQTIRYNPFEDAKYERVERKIRCLGKTDVARILAMPFQNKEAEFVRRIFLFSVFTGLAFADVSKLRYCDIQTNNAGIRYIRQYRKKTDVESITPLHPIAGQILSQFPPKEKKEDSLIFETSLSRIQIGMHLKAIGLACGIRQPLSFHVGRHSFGTLTLEAGVPIESIAKMMGHASIASTQIYAQITDSKISKDMNKLIEKSVKY